MLAVISHWTAAVGVQQIPIQHYALPVDPSSQLLAAHRRIDMPLLDIHALHKPGPQDPQTTLHRG
jgi:hypothetical protein